jgi:hypothetical protein
VAQSGALCRRIRGQQHPSPSIAPDQDKRRFSRRDQVGRKSETTLRIASLHFEISTFSSTATDQLKLPPGATDARHRQWG